MFFSSNLKYYVVQTQTKIKTVKYKTHFKKYALHNCFKTKPSTCKELGNNDIKYIYISFFEFMYMIICTYIEIVK